MAQLHRKAFSSVDNVVKKLPTDKRAMVSRDIITSTEEALRKLAIKVQVGQLGKGDSVENRAAILLDLILRKSGQAPIQNLALICGMKNKDLESISFKVGNYVDSKSNQCHEGYSCRSSPRFNSKLLETEVAAARKETTIIPTLSVKLGSYIPGSLGFAKLTQLLIKDIQVYLSECKDRFQRTGYLHDMKRKKKEYEAVCFFFIMEENQVKQRHQLKPLLLEAANVKANEFEAIYKEARKFFEAVRCQKKRSLPVGVVSKKRQKANVNNTVKTVTELLDLAESLGDNNVEADAPEKQPSHYTYSENFQMWREKVLSQAIEQEREEKGIELTHSQALHDAATRMVEHFQEENGIVDCART